MACSKKDYERAALLVQDYVSDMGEGIIDLFVDFFNGDNPRFDERRFRDACVVGANVKARPRSKRSAA